MPDGYDRRPSTGDRAQRGVPPRPYDDPRAVPGRPEEDDDYADALDDPGAGPRKGRARRLASWLGFGPAPEEADLYDEPADTPSGGARGRSYERDLHDDDFREPVGYDSYDGHDNDEALEEPRPSRVPPRPQGPAPRRKGPSPWEDIMLGTGLSPGAPMSDPTSDPAADDTLPPADTTTVIPPARGTSRPPRPSGAPRRSMPPAYGDMGLASRPPRPPRPADPVDPLDPADPADPVDRLDAVDPADGFFDQEHVDEPTTEPVSPPTPTVTDQRNHPSNPVGMVDIVGVVDITDPTETADPTLVAPILVSHNDVQVPNPSPPSQAQPPDDAAYDPESDDEVDQASVTAALTGLTRSRNPRARHPAQAPTAPAQTTQPPQSPTRPAPPSQATGTDAASATSAAAIGLEDGSSEPRRMLRLMPSPVLADGGGMVADGGRLGQLTVRCAGIRGALHQQQGVARGNTFAVGPDPTNRWAIAVLCDGVDGTYAPELAAQVAVRAAFRSVARMVARERHEEWDWTGLMTGLNVELADRLGNMADRAHEGGRSAPTTRVSVLVTAVDQDDDDRVDMAVIGDSTVLRLAEGGWRAPLGISEMLSGDRPPALPGDGIENLKVCRTTWRPSDALVMMTGGFAASLGEPTGGLAARLADEWHKPPEVFDFLRDVDTGLGMRTDDAAVVALWPRP